MKTTAKFNNFILILQTIFTLLMISGCEDRKEAKKISLKNVAHPEKSQTATTVESLHIAVSAMISPKETFVYYKEILDYLGEKLNIPVKLVQRETYAEVNELLRKQELDAAFVCTGAYIDGHEEFDMELLVAPIVYNKATYQSYIIVPKKSKLTTFEDLRGKIFAFTDPMSNTGKLSPSYMLAQINETADSFFETYTFTYSHDKSIKAVAQSLVDGAAVDSLVWDFLAAKTPKYTSQTKIIKKSSPYGIPPIVVPPGLDPLLKNKLRNVFLQMHEDVRGRQILNNLMIDRFIVINDSAYESTREIRTWVDTYNAK